MRLFFTAAALSITAATANAQAPPRAMPRTVTIEIAGEAPHERLAWQFDASQTSTIQVRVRTARGERAVKDVASDQESVERMFTLRGSFVRSTPITTALWRILDAGARLNDPKAEVTDPDNDPLGSGASENVGETFEARLAKLSDKTLKRLNGGSLKQKAEPAGLMASGTIPVLEDLSVRTYAEALNLAFYLGLSEVALPETPVGVGARWTAEFRSELGGAPVKTTIAWTLKARTGDLVKLGITYETRVVEATNDRKGQARVARLARNGHGEVTIDLSRPLELGARLIQLPLPGNTMAPDVSWITVTSMRTTLGTVR